MFDTLDRRRTEHDVNWTCGHVLAPDLPVLRVALAKRPAPPSGPASCAGGLAVSWRQVDARREAPTRARRRGTDPGACTKPNPPTMRPQSPCCPCAIPGVAQHRCPDPGRPAPAAVCWSTPAGWFEGGKIASGKTARFFLDSSEMRFLLRYPPHKIQLTAPWWYQHRLL